MIAWLIEIMKDQSFVICSVTLNLNIFPNSRAYRSRIFKKAHGNEI